MSEICVDIGSPDLSIAEQWDGLCRRAAPNVFLSPAALNAAHATNFAKIHVLRAWDKSATPDRLVGMWAFEERKIVPLWPAFLAAPPYDYAFVSTPVIDPTFMDEVIPAFFDAIEHAPALPNVIRLTHLDGDCDAYRAIAKALSARTGQSLALSEHERPFLAGQSELKHSGSTRKKLRQDWKKLSALGVAAVVNARTAPAARAAFEVFLALEGASWKGKHGTALLSDIKDAEFARRLIGDLADRGCASVALLHVDDRPIAAQVLLYCGTMAYTWKTAFDAEYAKYSPGALLIDKVTEDLLTTQGVTQIESCSPEGSFMAQLWTGRRATVDLLLDVGAEKSLNFKLAALAERGYAQAKAWRGRLRAINWPLPKRRGLAASR